MGGSSIIWHRAPWCAGKYWPSFLPFGVGGELVESWWLWWVVSGTLLGPEGSDACVQLFSCGPYLFSYHRGVPSLLLGCALAGACGGVPPVC